MQHVVLVVHDVRSAHNVGSILRSADGFGVEAVYLTGYSPYPVGPNDKRLPYVAKRAGQQIAKTALGAEKTLHWLHETDISKLVVKLKKAGFLVVALEQTDKSVNLANFKTDKDVALIVGSEIGGIKLRILKAADVCVEIPMSGKKESLNVSVAAAIALYHLRYFA
ncbi:TrmH family RNA methyltransferase [Candidatus Saccharibacteria bacterium]|nr:TrmH family RNA methyltransferase [Candidatus Saccharibacteria bacterium]